MYKTGSIIDFENRLHQLPTGQNDLNSFITEGMSYLNVVYFYQLQKWNNEFAKKSYTLLNNNQYYINPVFAPTGSSNGIIGLDGYAIIGMDGNQILSF